MTNVSTKKKTPASRVFPSWDYKTVLSFSNERKKAFDQKTKDFGDWFYKIILTLLNEVLQIKMVSEFE
ncbi:CLUMA_CG017090, isoform A [Clunio marinus]|uniref:CLUMA_CG017090, isoform A n=1 Tax=Clunio marinus TaxID=568069 RepID=A0A1J1IZF8_9DIPT|nr:CLUMA_CG017090, isoform A [Clunio marinus]